MRLSLVILVMILAGCSSGAVVFAPTPLPQDFSAARYDHPSGAFSLNVPRNWSVYTQNTTTLATAAFAAPDSVEPEITIAVIKLGETLDSSGFSDLLNLYQAQIRPDVGKYTEQNRQAMGDGSWRMTGLRQTAGGATEQVNTFIEQSENLLGVIDVIVPDDNAQMTDLQAIINTFQLNGETGLQAAELSSLVSVANASLDIIHLFAWTTPTGVFFITGEVANNGSEVVTGIPVRAVLFTEDGLPTGEAIDTPMGYGLPPGEFAPFSLRFGQGQPALTTRFEIDLGSADWQADPEAVIYSANEMQWTDESTFDNNEQIIISGSVTNISPHVIHNPRAIVTVFDNAQHVIAAGFSDLSVPQLAPDESADFQIAMPEIGGEPAQYIVNVQGLP
jgi:hypothetical protein